LSIVLKVDHNVTYIKGRLGSEVYKELKKELGYLPEGSFWMIKQNSENNKEKWKQEWDGYVTTVCWNKEFCRCHIKKSGTHFQSGLLSKACNFFKKKNIEYKLIDIRKKTPKTDDYSMSEEFESRDYQTEVIDKITKGKGIDRGIIKMATGSGKSPVACAIIAGIGVTPSIFYVPSISLLKQTKDEIEKFIRYKGSPVKVGMVGGGEKDIQDITVMTIQTAVRALGGVWVKFDDEDINKDDTDIEDMKENIINLIKNCRLMVADETQHWAAETCQIISDNSISCQYKYSMSATPHRDLGDDILIDACFGRTIADVNASFLIKKSYLVKPHIYFCTINNMRGKSERKSYQTIYKEAIVENEVRNQKIVDFANYFNETGRKTLILVKQIAHGKLLEEMIPGSVFVYGSTSKKKREEHLEKMRNGWQGVTVSSVVFDEGINCKPLDTLILAGSGKSSSRALQRIGRILRPYPGKKDAIVVDFLDRCKYLESHSKKREKIYKSEEEFIIERPK